MGLYNKFRASDKLENGGIELDLDFCKIKLARAGGNNQKYNAAMAQIAKKHKRAIDYDLLSTERSRAMLYEVYAETVILDWRSKSETGEYIQGIEDETGDLLPFNKENVIATFQNLPELFATVKETAENLQFFRQSILDEAAKN